MLSYEASGANDASRPAPEDVASSAPFLTEQQRAIRAIVVGLMLGAALAALARRS
jgi:hypothetical protein